MQNESRNEQIAEDADWKFSNV